MTTLSNRAAAGILGWCLLPFALFDILVLLWGYLESRGFLPSWGITMFVLFYMVGGLVIWVALMTMALSRRSPRFTRVVWGLHTFFNLGASLLWVILAFVCVGQNRGTLLCPLVITVPVLLWAGYFFFRSFQAIDTN